VQLQEMLYLRYNSLSDEFKVKYSRSQKMGNR
jgi:hypothetical protein